MGKSTYNRMIMTGEDLRDGIDRGMSVIYDVARTAYGVRSGNVMIEKPCRRTYNFTRRCHKH
jgi:hypothetical protein